MESEQKERGKVRVSIQFALTVVSTGLVTLTALLIGTTFIFNTRKVVDELSDRLFAGAFREITLVTEERLGGVDEVLGANRSLLAEGLVGPDEFDKLGRHLVGVLRLHPFLTEVGYGDRLGRAVWAERAGPGGAISCHKVSPAGDGSAILEIQRYGDGATPVSTEERVSDYDPRGRPWYQAGAGSNRPAWTAPYVFTSGVPGLSRTWRLTDDSGEVVGVFDASFELDFLSGYLAVAVEEFPGDLCIVNFGSDGEVIAHSDPALLIDRSESGWAEIPTIASLGDPRLVALKDAIRIENVGEWRDGRWHGRLEVGGEAFVAITEPLTGMPRLDWSSVLLVPADVIEGPIRRSNAFAVLIALGATALGILVAFAMSKRLSHRLRVLSSEIEDVGQLVLSDRPPQASMIREVNVLENSVHAMKVGLHSFRKFVPAELVRSLLERGDEARLGGKRREVTLLFTDIVGYTGICESLEPEQLVTELGDYLEEMTQVIETRGGTVNQYVGDAIMAIFGAPTPLDRHPLKACEAALAFRQRDDELALEAERQGRSVFRSRIGINTGEAIVGNLGSKSRLYFTANGDEVNLASRLEGINNYYGTGIAISEATRSEVEDRMVCRLLDRVAVKGRRQGENIYELVGNVGEVADEDLEFIAAYEAAFESFLRRAWDDAEAGFSACLDKRPADKPSKILKARCRGFQVHEPPDLWEGVNEMQQK